MTHSETRYYNDIMLAYKQGKSSYNGHELGFQRAGTETQKQTYKMEFSKCLAAKIAASGVDRVCPNCGCPEPKKTYTAFWCGACHNEFN